MRKRYIYGYAIDYQRLHNYYFSNSLTYLCLLGVMSIPGKHFRCDIKILKFVKLFNTVAVCGSVRLNSLFFFLVINIFLSNL